MTVFINPGSGPVAGANEHDAITAMVAFVADLADRGIYVTGTRRVYHLDADGRFGFSVSFRDGRTLEIEMPGLPVEAVRWMDAETQNIWDFPRLYVEGSSWVWYYALGACKA